MGGQMETRREFLTKTASITAAAWGAMGVRSETQR